ncbi:glycosyltransferase [Marinobacter sp. VGCF2001]|uniref:glycosyltransferase n=1 Tax=Marinobacter sp. VGCF2001 TaxID=3417189 RepID=UPI003CE936DD
MSIEHLKTGDLVPKPPEPKSEAEIIAGWKGDWDKPVVSICCITFNHQSYIEDAIRGFLSQVTDFPFEILINDDASADQTPKIIKSYADRYPKIIKPIIQDENQFSKRVSPNISFNFPRAKGEFIALCEGDDFWLSTDKIRKQVSVLRNHPDSVLCFHDARKIDESGLYIDDMIPCNQRYLTRTELAKAPFSPTLTRMFRNVGFPWGNERDLPTAMDVCLAAYLSKFGGAVYLGNEVLSAYRVHCGGVWSLKNQCQKTRMTVDSRLYMAAHFRLERDEPDAEDAFDYHMALAVKTILDQLKLSIAIKSVCRYFSFRGYAGLRGVSVRVARSLITIIRSR